MQFYKNGEFRENFIVAWNSGGGFGGLLSYSFLIIKEENLFLNYFSSEHCLLVSDWEFGCIESRIRWINKRDFILIFGLFLLSMLSGMVNVLTFVTVLLPATHLSGEYTCTE